MYVIVIKYLKVKLYCSLSSYQIVKYTCLDKKNQYLISKCLLKIIIKLLKGD